MTNPPYLPDDLGVLEELSLPAEGEALLRFLPTTLFVEDLELGRIVWQSRVGTDLLGDAAETVLAAGMWERRLHPDDLARLPSRAAKYHARFEGPVRHRYRMRHADGTWRWLQSEAVVLSRGPGQAPLRALGVVQDVTEAVADAEQRSLLTEAVAHAGEAVVIADIDGFIEYANPAFERISGYASAEVVGRHLRMLRSAHHEAAFYEAMWATLRAGNTWKGIFVNRSKAGALYREEATISPVRDGEGAPA